MYAGQLFTFLPDLYDTLYNTNITKINYILTIAIDNYD